MRVSVLGPLQVWDEQGRPIEVGGARLRALLARLALSAGTVVTVETLIDGLWGEQPPAGAVNALQSLVSRLRRTLPNGSVESLPYGYRLTADVDAATFERLAADGRAALGHGDPQAAAALLADALALWRGPALADVADAPFAAAPAGRLEELRLAATEDRLEAELALGRYAEVAAAAAGLAGTHPMRERLHGQLITALYGAGRQAEALAAYHRIRQTLADELGVDPSPVLEAVHLAVLRGEAGPARSAPAPPTNLRAALTSFVGREEELTRLAKQLEESRLVTLLGPGGAGKTRLAAEVGARVADLMPDGRWMVELAPVTDPLEVPQAVLSALGIREAALLERRGADRIGADRIGTDHIGADHIGTDHIGADHIGADHIGADHIGADHIGKVYPGTDRIGAGSAPDRIGTDRTSADRGRDAVARIVGALAGKRALLILDNAEHLIDAVAWLADQVLGGCPQVRVLATSREPLGITGETLSLLPPLAMPPDGAGQAEAMEYASVRLFADRGAAARPDFAVTAGNVAAVVEICRRLDGLPLALELAAARLRALSSEQIAARLGDRFRLLTGGSRTALPRHRTLAAVVEWSWDLLDPAERAVLRRLSVCPGGATLEAAERICAGPEVPRDAVLDLLAALVDKSLVTPAGGVDVPGGAEPRYRMLETIRAYGADRLAEAGEADRVRAGHAGYFLELAETAEPHLRGLHQLRWLGRLSADNDNMLAALRWAIDTGRADTAVRLAAALGGFWLLRGSRTENAAWLSEALAVPGGEPTVARAVAAANQGLALLGAGELQAAVAALRQAREVARQVNAPDGPSLIMVEPLLALLAENGAGLEAQVERNLDSPDPWSRAMTRLLRGHLRANEGDQDGAEADMTRALEEFREQGDRFGRAIATSALGWARAVRGDNAGAGAVLEEALAMLAELGANDEMAELHSRLALTRRRGGDLAGARTALAAAEAIAERYGGLEIAITVEITRAELARAAGHLAEARRWYEAALARMRTWASFGQLRALTLAGLGYAAVAAGELDRARTWLADAVETAITSRDMPVAADVAQAVADLALAGGDAERAAALLGVAVALRGTADEGSPDLLRVRAAATAALGAAGYAQAQRRGAALPRDAALAELRRELG